MSHLVRLYPSSCAALQTAVFGPIIRSGCQFAVTWREEAPASYEEYTLNLRITQESGRMRKGHMMQEVYSISRRWEERRRIPGKLVADSAGATGIAHLV